MEDSEKRQHLIARYELAAHAMQTGVAAEIEQAGHKAAAADPKYLRTGVNAAMVDSSALAGLLIGKGFITEEEYLTAIAIGMETEKARYEKLLLDKYGLRVTLG